MRRGIWCRIQITAWLLMISVAVTTGHASQTTGSKTQTKTQKPPIVLKSKNRPASPTPDPNDRPEPTSENSKNRATSPTTTSGGLSDVLIENRRPSSMPPIRTLHSASPVYPPELRDAGITGTVKVRVDISSEGDVTNVSAVSGPPEFYDAAFEAAYKWKFEPVLLNNRPVRISGVLTFGFVRW